MPDSTVQEKTSNAPARYDQKTPLLVPPSSRPMTLLARFTQSLNDFDSAAAERIVDDVAAYIDWHVGRAGGEFVPHGSDDVDLRTYLLHLRLDGVRREALHKKITSLRRFYNWVMDEGLIDDNPFEDFDFDRPLLSGQALLRRRETLPSDPREREIARLRALNQLAQLLNQAANIRAILDTTLETLTEVMGLETAWLYVLPEVHQYLAAVESQPPHDFVPVAACGLPPGLEQRERYFLCQPPDCHCQDMLREGRMTRAVNVVECTRLQDSARAEGDNRGLFFHASTPLYLSGRPTGIINVATPEWQFLTAADLQFLSTVGAQVSVALERALLYDLARAQQGRLERELEMAREMQASLLPETLPDIPGYTLAAFWHAAREVAGDFYDLFDLPGGRWALVVADVSDKGAPAALYMAMARSLIRTCAEANSSPAAALRQVNQLLLAHSTADMFVTVFFAVLHPATGRLSYAGAGHDPPFLRRANGELIRLAPTGPLLGILEDLPLAEKTLTLEPGDALLAYTDGVTDALNEAGLEYGAARLAAALERAPESAPALLTAIRDDFTAFTGAAPQFDDITLLALTRQPS